MAATIRLFVMVGRGTLAPWNPPERLVVQGVYRHVRNPMISGVFFVLLFIVNVIHIPLSRGAGLGQAVWRRLPDLQAKRAKMDFQPEAVKRRAARSGGEELGTAWVGRLHVLEDELLQG